MVNKEHLKLIDLEEAMSILQNGDIEDRRVTEVVIHTMRDGRTVFVVEDAAAVAA